MEPTFYKLITDFPGDKFLYSKKVDFLTVRKGFTGLYKVGCGVPQKKYLWPSLNSIDHPLHDKSST